MVRFENNENGNSKTRIISSFIQKQIAFCLNSNRDFAFHSFRTMKSGPYIKANQSVISEFVVLLQIETT